MIFFVATSEANDKFNLKLTNQNMNGLGNIGLILLKKLKRNGTEIVQRVYSIDFDLRKNYDIDKKTGKNIIPLRFQLNNKGSFKINILINKIPNKNYYFIYDVDHYEQKKKSDLTVLKLSKFQQFNLFRDLFRYDDFYKNIKEFEPKSLEMDLLEDSKYNLIDSNNKLSLEFFLELLNIYYKKEEANILLKFLQSNWDCVYECEQLDSYYSEMLDDLENKFEKKFKKFFRKN